MTSTSKRNNVLPSVAVHIDTPDDDKENKISPSESKNLVRSILFILLCILGYDYAFHHLNHIADNVREGELKAHAGHDSSSLSSSPPETVVPLVQELNAVGVVTGDIHPALLADLESLPRPPAPPKSGTGAAVLWSERDFNGVWTLVDKDMVDLPKGFRVESIQVSPRVDHNAHSEHLQADEMIDKVGIILYEKPNFLGRYVELYHDMPQIADWSHKIRSIAVRRRVRKAMGDITHDDFLVITNRMGNKYIPGNVRALDIAAGLRGLEGTPEVHFLTFDGHIDPIFQSHMDHVGIHYHSDDPKHPVKNEPHFDIIPLLQENSFHTIFLFLWFWTEKTGPEKYLDSIRAFSPQSRIVVVTDDAQGVREKMMKNTLEYFPQLVREFSWLADHERVEDLLIRERNTYLLADMIVCLTDTDKEHIEQTMLPAFQLQQQKQVTTVTQGGAAAVTPVHVLHWGTDLTRVPIPAIASLPIFEKRIGMVFLGHFDNPTNRLGLEWFFHKVFPLLPTDVKKHPITLIGGELKAEEKDVLSHLSSTGANIEMAGRLSNKEMLTVLQAHRLLFAPILASTGLNTKNFYGMCSGIPVLTTSLGAQGFMQNKYKGTPMMDKLANSMIKADDAEGFAREIVRLHNTKEAFAAALEGGLAMAHELRSSNQFHVDLLDILNELHGMRADVSKRPASTFVSSIDNIHRRFTIKKTKTPLTAHD